MPASERREKQPLQVLPFPVSLNFLLHIFSLSAQSCQSLPLGPTPLSSKPHCPSCWAHLTSWHTPKGIQRRSWVTQEMLMNLCPVGILT